MPKTANEVGDRIIDEFDAPGEGDWKHFRDGELSVQAWAESWNGASVQLQLSHDKIHAVDIDDGVLTEVNSGMLGLPSGVYLRAVVTGDPEQLVVSVAPTAGR
ncbi:MAG: hypothetical protein AAGJ83_10525 [Planctomycetota bacterium]